MCEVLKTTGYNVGAGSFLKLDVVILDTKAKENY